jgi:hypothetical protein
MLSHDCQWALKTLNKHRGFAALAIMCSALGIGLATALFSAINGTLLHPVPFPAPQELVSIWESKVSAAPVSYPNFLDWSSDAHSFSAIAAYYIRVQTLTGSHDAISARITSASQSLCSVLQVRLAIGRCPRDAINGSPNEIALSSGAWREYFGGAETVLGRTIYLDQRPFVVVGVMPSDVQFPVGGDRIDAYVTVEAEASSNASLQKMAHDRGEHFLQVIGRLNPGVNIQTARSELRVISTRLQKRYAEDATRGSFLESFPEAVVRPIAPALKVLGIAVIFVLMVTCATLALLSLVRAENRKHEISVRVALGADSAQLVSQLMLESIVISFIGGGCGGCACLGNCCQPNALGQLRNSKCRES